MKTLGRLSFLIPAGTFVASIFYLIGCLDLNYGTTSLPQEGFVPYIFGTLLSGGSFILVVNAIVKGRKMETPPKRLSREELINVLMLIGVLIGYVILLPVLGLVISISLLVVASTKIMRVRWRTITLLAVTTTILSYFIFVYWLKVPLPSGFFM